MKFRPFLILLLLVFTFSSKAQVVVSEIMYNPPEPNQDTLEYIELYNSSNFSVNMEGWSFSAGPVLTFPAFSLPPGGYVIVCKDAAYFQNLFGSIPVITWVSGALGNTGSTITLVDAIGNEVTTLSYTNASPWPGGKANGLGASIVLCDLNSNPADPANWKAATTKTGIFHYGLELLANPLAPSDCQTASDKALVLTGVFDAQPAAAGAKGVEVYVLEDIPDLSIYGLGSANNGGGSDGEEFTFPSQAVSKGTFIYVAADSALFRDFFGFDAHYISGAMNINGDDAIELFEIGEVIDVFGDIDVDGTGEPWEYLDGWAYRVDGTGPDGSTFILDHWYFSGVGGLLGNPTNMGSPNPFPLGTYTPDNNVLKANNDIFTVDPNVTSALAVLNNDLIPNGYTVFELVEMPVNGSGLVNINDISYTPFTDYCGPDQFSYRICDALDCDTATVFITVQCDKTYPDYPIGLVTTVDGNGVLDSLGVDCTLTGVVYGVNLRPGGLQFVMIDNQNDGITVFSGASGFGYVVAEGDLISVKGTIAQYFGLAQIQPDEVNLLATNQTLFAPTIVTQFDESIESQLIQLENVSIIDPAEWTNMGPGFNVRLTNGIDEFEMRIDDDVSLYGTTPPVGTFRLTGLGTQFSSQLPHDDEYQIMPRYISDIDMIQSTDEIANEYEINLWPNPASGMSRLESKSSLHQVLVMDQLGRSVGEALRLDTEGFTWHLDTQSLPEGLYRVLSMTQRGKMQSVALLVVR